MNTLIFYEDQYAESLLNGTKKSKRLTFFDLCMVAMYIRDVIGKSKEQTYNDLVAFCKENNPDFNEILGSRKLKAAVNKTDLYGVRKKRDIKVTKSEMETIRSAFSDYKYQKVMFAMLIVAKFFHNKDHYRAKNKTTGGEKYYVNQSLNKIFKTAKVHVRKKDRYTILYDLQQAGYIEATLRGTFEILFVDEESPVEILITNLNDIESFFPYYCIVCGKKYDREPYSKNQMCDSCYQEKRRRDERERMRKARE